jgi:phage terminase large subunit-like protein
MNMMMNKNKTTRRKPLNRSLRTLFIQAQKQRALPDLLAMLSPAEIVYLLHHWPLFAREDQLPPSRAAQYWTTWLMMGGRGAGKTRAGAEWVRGLALGHSPFATQPMGRIALVGETMADVRDVMIEGISGLLVVHPRSERPVWLSSRRRLEWPNGAVAQVFSSEDPDALRGPQFHCAWCDELAKWRHPQETWDMLQFGLRLGEFPRQMVTTTPRPIPLIKKLIEAPLTVLTRAATRANAFNLAPAFLEAVVGRYRGTRLGRQELEGELIEERADALWSRALLENSRLPLSSLGHGKALEKIVVAVDPPAASHKRADACGIIAAGIDRDGLVHVLADESAQGLKPQDWSRKAIALYHRLEADSLVIEVNQGGDMAVSVLREADPSVPVTMVRASRGKYLRAEPVAMLYAQGRVRHVGTFPLLEDELCDFGPGGLSTGASPDRLDALVWAITKLALEPHVTPRVRML